MLKYSLYLYHKAIYTVTGGRGKLRDNINSTSFFFTKYYIMIALIIDLALIIVITIAWSVFCFKMERKKHEN